MRLQWSMDLLCCTATTRRKTHQSSYVPVLARRADFPPATEDSEAYESVANAEIIARVVQADLAASERDFFGYMDLFAVVEWESSAGSRWPVSRTRTLWMSSLQPVWEHECPRQPYVYTQSPQPSGNDHLVFEVMQEQWGGLSAPTSRGSVRVKVSELLEPVVSAQQSLTSGSSPSGTVTGPRVELLLVSSVGAAMGTLTVQASLLRLPRSVSPSSFRTPSANSGQQPVGFPAGLSPTGGRFPAKQALGVFRTPSLRPQQSLSTTAAMTSASSRTRSPSSSSDEDNDTTPAEKLAQAMSKFGAAIRNAPTPAAANAREDVVMPRFQGLLSAEEPSEGSDDDVRKSINRPPAVSQEAQDQVSTHCTTESEESESDVGQVCSSLTPEEFHDMVVRLRIVAKKYPKSGKSIIRRPRDRFFAVTQSLVPRKDTDTKASQRSFHGEASLRDCQISWFEDEASFVAGRQPLGFIMLVHIVGIGRLEEAAEYCELKIDYIEPEDNAGSLVLVFEKTNIQPGRQWRRHLREFLALVNKEVQKPPHGHPGA